ncbi:MAG: DUF3187 family protein [Acidobacteriota bacterium]
MQPRIMTWSRLAGIVAGGVACGLLAGSGATAAVRSRDCAAGLGHGPFEFPSQSPLQGLRPSLRPRSPVTVPRGHWDLHVDTTWANLWAVDKVADRAASAFFIDAETLQAHARLAYGLTRRVQIEGGVEMRSHFGGIGDSAIETWHDFFGLPQAGRDLAARDQFIFDLTPADGRAAVRRHPGDSGIFNRSFELALTQRFTCGSGRLPLMAYTVTARLETDNDFVGDGNPIDLGASVSFAQHAGPTSYYATLGSIRFGDDDLRGLTLARSQYMVSGTFEWRIVRRHSILVQYLLTQGQIDGFGPFSRPSHEIVLGWKGEIGAATQVEAAFIENIVELDNSPDFGLHVGLSHRF